ncbi:MAG TPA: mechanosensitive ion channel domain-containing protein [Clostridia bacterium]|nr:mechanosensitive ion channel domain-containing protein [Clostridia bacterium]
MEEVWLWLRSFFESTGINIVTALVVLFAGLTIAKLISRTSRVYLQKTPMESTTISFVISIINFVLYLVITFSCISIVFPDASTELIAILGTAAIAIGLALQGSLSNFASGIIIIFTKPFKEGDYVDIGTLASGTVKSIGLLHTEVLSIDNQKVILGNSNVINSTITNYNAKLTRQLNFTINVSYGSDIDEVKKILFDIANNHEKILKVPKPLIRLLELGESALVFRFRAWVNTSEYWGVYYDIQETVYKTFQEKGIVIPYKKINVSLTDKEDK